MQAARHLHMPNAMAGSTCPALDGRSCDECLVGRVADTDRGQFCPLVTRTHRPGDVLVVAGQPAEYVWFVVRGVLGSASAADNPGNVDNLVVAGHFAGLECLLGRPYRTTVQAVTPATVCGATREGFLAWVAQSEQRKALVTRMLLADAILAREIGFRLAAVLDGAVAAQSLAHILHSQRPTAHGVRSACGAMVANRALHTARRVQKSRS